MLDISYLSDTLGDKPYLQLSDAEVKRVQGAFIELREKTGLYIDPYGRSRIYPRQQKMLIALLLQDIDRDVLALVDFLKFSSDADEVLLVDGD